MRTVEQNLQMEDLRIVEDLQTEEQGWPTEEAQGLQTGAAVGLMAEVEQDSKKAGLTIEEEQDSREGDGKIEEDQDLKEVDWTIDVKQNSKEADLTIEGPVMLQE